MKHLAAILTVLLMSVSCYGENWHKLDNVKVSDGDTLRADVSLGWGVVLQDQSIRALDFDAPEISHTRDAVDVTDDEILRGQAAKAALKVLVAAGTVEVSPRFGGKRDRYGRMLAVIRVKSKDGKAVLLSVWAKQNGFTRTPEPPK